MTVTYGPWRAVWDGGRLMDIYHSTVPDYPLDCAQVGDFDWNPPEGGSGRLVEEPTRKSLRAELKEWAKENGPDYLRELPYLR